jgi:hypothetical protein
MKDTFSFLTFTAAAISFAVFLTTFQSDSLPEMGWNPVVTAAAYAPGNGCRLQGPLLADIRDRLDALVHPRDV